MCSRVLTDSAVCDITVATYVTSVSVWMFEFLMCEEMLFSETEFTTQLTLNYFINTLLYILHADLTYMYSTVSTLTFT